MKILGKLVRALCISVNHQPSHFDLVPVGQVMRATRPWGSSFQEPSQGWVLGPWEWASGRAERWGVGAGVSPSEQEAWEE